MLIILPRKLLKDVIREVHASLTGDHFGIGKSLARARMKYYWIGMAADVRSALREYDVCARRKCPSRTPRAPLQQRISGHPLERVALDILGPFPRTRSGNKYVLVIGDYMTKWMEAYPIPDERAETVAEKLVVEFTCRFGVPRYVHSDQGRNFISHVFTEVCRLLGVTKTRTTAYNPKSNGLNERYNRTLVNTVAALLDVERQEKDWDTLIPFATCAYRSCPQDFTGETPNMLMLGRQVAMPGDLAEPDDSDAPSVEVQTNFASDLRARMQRAHERARATLKRACRRQKNYYDRKTQAADFSVGRYAWLRRKMRQKGRSPKLQTKWLGPYRVVTRLSDVTVRLQMTPRTKQLMTHVDRLKAYTGVQRPVWEFRPTQAEERDEGASHRDASSDEECCELLC